MALIYLDRVQETTTTTGLTAYFLNGAVPSYQSFDDVGNGNTCYYAATDGRSWEVGLGTFTLSNRTLARTTILASSNSGNAVDWRAGQKNIWLDYPAEVINTTISGLSVETANGFAGTVTSGPIREITLSTTVTGILEGNGTAIAAVNGFVPTTSGGEANVADRSALAAVDTTRNTVAYLMEDRREGWFGWNGANLAASVTLDPAQGVFVAPASDLTGASGAWVRDSGTITPFMFGALANGSADDGSALNAFFAFAASFERIVETTGTFLTSVPIIVGFPTGSTAPASKAYTGMMKVTATAAIPILVSLRNLQQCVWSGGINATGTGSVTYSSRTCEVGVSAENCGRMHIDKIQARSFLHSGFLSYLAAVGGDTDMTVDNITAIYCSSGVPDVGSSLTANWSLPVNSGSSGSIGQRTNITVDVVPPSWIFNYGSITQQPVYVRISDQIYRVVDFDAGAMTMNIAPWLDNVDIVAGSGTLQYIFGAGILLQGGDNNVLFIGNADSQTCGVGFRMGALYGSTVGSMTMQNCGVGLWLGTNVTNSAIGYNIGFFYNEGNSLDIVYMPGIANWGAIQTVSEHFAFSGALAFNQARTGAATPGQPLGQLGKVSVNYRGIPLFYEKVTAASSSALGDSLALAGPPIPKIITANSGTVTLPTLATDIFQSYGYDSKIIAFVGTGANGQPSGTLTFNPPAGQTINGLASVAFAGFTGPPIFLLKYNFTTLDWSLTLSSGRSAPVGVTTIATNAAANLTPWTTFPTVIHTGVLTADRLLTLVTTNAIAGVTRFTVTRTGAGAFNLSVGGLKNLTTGTWCEVVFDGSAFVLTEYGTL